MGRRGLGARRLIDPREQGSKRRKRREPWRKAGLNRVIAFLQWLPVTKGMRAGKRMRLLPRQIEFIRKVYDGRTRIGIDSEPRGNGKTGLTVARSGKRAQRRDLRRWGGPHAERSAVRRNGGDDIGGAGVRRALQRLRRAQSDLQTADVSADRLGCRTRECRTFRRGARCCATCSAP